MSPRTNHAGGSINLCRFNAMSVEREFGCKKRRVINVSLVVAGTTGNGSVTRFETLSGGIARRSRYEGCVSLSINNCSGDAERFMKSSPGELCSLMLLAGSSSLVVFILELPIFKMQITL